MNTITVFSKKNAMLVSGFSKDIVRKHIEETCKELGVKFLVVIVQNSYYICIMTGVIGFILYMFGLEKAKKAPIIAFGVYLIIRFVGGVLCGI